MKLVHDEKKPFECNVCTVKFARKANLKQHIDTIHDGIRAFQCEFCNSTFTQKSTLKAHVKVIHKEKTIIKPKSTDITDLDYMVKEELPEL